MKKLSVILLLGLFGCEKEKQPEIGKLYFRSYSYLHHPENPFAPNFTDTVEVLDVKQDYVKFKFKSTGVILSDEVRWFNKVTRKIE